MIDLEKAHRVLDSPVKENQEGPFIQFKLDKWTILVDEFGVYCSDQDGWVRAMYTVLGGVSNVTRDEAKEVLLKTVEELAQSGAISSD